MDNHKKCLKQYIIISVSHGEVAVEAFSPKEALKYLFPNDKFEVVARGNRRFFMCGIDYDCGVNIPMKDNGTSYRYYKKINTTEENNG